MITELNQQQQMALWESRARDSDMRSLEADAELCSRLDKLEPKLRQALDIGCGCGRHTLELARRGWRVTGLDWSADALTRAHQVLGEAGQVGTMSRGDWRRMPFTSGFFALIVATSVYQHGHLADFKRSMLELKRVLKVGGTAIVSVPARENAPPAHWGVWPEPGTVVLDRTAEAGLAHHFFSLQELEQAVRAFPRGAKVSRVEQPFPRGFEPCHSEQRNVWYWLTLTG
ncbi:class I SAM-dependent methyltransferase [bacterium]|nr:class I SAM-dependent methyltransferase [bacterium]